MKYLTIFSLILAFVYSCESIDLIQPAGFKTDVEADSIVFAQIGDFGYSGASEKSVSMMVKSWNPDFIISVGDNNYSEGKLSTIKANITDYYGDYIYNFDAPIPYQCNGKAFRDRINRFFTTPGNHDANNRDGLIPYYNFFTLPDNEIFYKFNWGPVAFYSINTTEDNLPEQQAWLSSELVLTDRPFNIVFLHHPPYSSGPHGNNELSQWDFYSMGVDIVFAGHDHIYERIEKTGEESMHYIVNGLGGKATGECSDKLLVESFTSLCYGNNYGAVKATATRNKLIVEFYSIDSPAIPVDRLEIIK